MNNSILENYVVPANVLDETINSLENNKNSPYLDIIQMISSMKPNQFNILNETAKLSFLNMGVTYALYAENETIEQVFPFDLFPRIINAEEWNVLEKGLIQRNIALNMFIHDVYNGAKIIHDNVVPKELVYSSAHYCQLMEGFSPRKNIYCHISGTDIIKHSDGGYYVLEDNLRSPSGVSYVLTNRKTMSRVIPSVFRNKTIESISSYCPELLKAMWSVSGKDLGDIFCVLLTPGVYNSAYFEHSFLAKEMGIELVEGRDLFVEDDFVYLNTIGGKIKVDVIYRRIDDAFIDPKYFKKDSLLGVHGIMDVYLKGNVTIINAPGTGISDDKAICAYVPDMIKYYLGEDAILHNVPTYICERPKDLAYVLENIQKLVVKPVDMSGGYGVCICDQMSEKEIEELKLKLRANPRNFIAQPKMMLSTHTTFIESQGCFEPRHIDLRTFTIMGGDQPFVLKGGLTRTALKKGNLIVNSSQGGGSKDTWVLKQ